MTGTPGPGNRIAHPSPPASKPRCEVKGTKSSEAFSRFFLTPRAKSTSFTRRRMNSLKRKSEPSIQRTPFPIGPRWVAAVARFHVRRKVLNRIMIMKIITIAFLIFGVINPLFCGEFSLDGWVFPGASYKEKASPYVSSTDQDGRKRVTQRTHLGQYVTEASFREVLAFYIEQSRLHPPNQRIVGRDFPGTGVFIPVHWVTRGEFGPGSVVTLLHYIRRDSATGVFSVVRHPDLGSIVVVVSRGKDGEQTVIQVICNPDPGKAGPQDEAVEATTLTRQAVEP